MKTDVKEFIKEHIHLIDENRWDEFYEIATVSEVFQQLKTIGEMTEFLHSCGCDPLAYLTVVPIGFLCESQIKEITLPTTITCIEMGAFFRSKELTAITIPATCNMISSNAFFGCSNLKKVDILSKKQLFGDDVFGRCYQLTEINYSGTKLEWLDHPLYDAQFTINCSDGILVVDAAGRVIVDE